MNELEKLPLVFNVYKPKGISSFDVVRHFKKNLNFDFGKIGHFGTLDPFAEGVLLIGINGAQRLNDYVHKYGTKVYRAVGVFGIKTNTGDRTGEIISSLPILEKYKNFSKEEIEKVFIDHFLGIYMQAPHTVSAAKFEGKPLYQHALDGKIIVKEKKEREIFSIKVLDYQFPKIEFVAEVSSGTYIRTLFEEFSEILGGDGHLEILERIKIGNFHSKDSIHRINWPDKNKKFNLENYGHKLDEVLSFPKLVLSNTDSKKLLCGIQIEMNLGKDSQKIYWIYSEDQILLGLSTYENGKLKTIFNIPYIVQTFCSTS